MDFQPCACERPHYERAERALWMRLFLPHLRRWKCDTCGADFMASKAAAQVAESRVWAPDTTGGFMAGSGSQQTPPPVA